MATIQSHKAKVVLLLVWWLNSVIATGRVS